MDAIEYYFRTTSLWIVLGLPIVFAILTFALSASYFRFIAAASFAVCAWWLLTQPAATYGQVFLWIGVLYIGLAIMMPFARVGSKVEDAVEKEETALDRYEARMKATNDRVQRLRSLGNRKTVIKNPYSGEED